jgi:hypothetical protein
MSSPEDRGGAGRAWNRRYRYMIDRESLRDGAVMREVKAFLRSFLRKHGAKGAMIDRRREGRFYLIQFRWMEL